MTVKKAAGIAVVVAFGVISAALYALIAIWVLARFGVRIPLGSVDHVALAYIPGAYWLARKAG